MNQTPISHDIGLQLPLPEGVLKVLLVFLFLIHILFVNFMVGGATFSFVFEIIGIWRKKYDALALKVAETVTVNKSLAVVLGVGPLLAINLAYTHYFYSATALTGIAWLMVIPLVTIAFLLTYLHKYTWKTWNGSLKVLHLSIGFLAMLLFWIIPLIFLANVNLMLFPSRWSQIQGFISAVLLQNVIPRYFHFMLATMAVTALFAVGWFGRKRFDVEKSLPGFSSKEVKQKFYMIAFLATMMQFLVGPLVLFTLPVHGISFKVYWIISIGILSALTFMLLVWNELRTDGHVMGRYFWTIILLLTTTVIAMAFGRHTYRERAISPHRQAMTEKSDEFYWKSEAARSRERLGLTKKVYTSSSEKDFKTNCSVCHAQSSVLIGPSLDEIISIYKESTEDLVKWTKEPKVKRGGAVMPSFKHLGDEKLLGISKYILGIED